MGVSVLLGLFAGGSASGQWRNSFCGASEDFGATDESFDRDIGFYLFDLPWLHYLVDSVMAFTVVAVLMAAPSHYLYGGVRLQTSHDRLSGPAQAQLSVLVGVFVLAKAGDYWLDRFDLVHQSGRLITGVTYTDDHAVLPAKNILMAIAIICAVLFFANVLRRTWLLPSVGLALLALSAILLGMIWPGIVQQFQVEPTEADKERPTSRRTSTPRGRPTTSRTWRSRTSPVRSRLATTRLGALALQTSTIPLVDPKLVAQTFEQQQQVRAYYSVSPVLDVDRYRIEGEDRALVLGVRELDQDGISKGDRNWGNLHTVYTHGNGVIAAFANQRPRDNETERGGIQWAEGQQANEDALTKLFPDGYESRVYFGEQSPDYSIVGKVSGAQDVELDLGNAGTDDQDETTTYDGEGGVKVDSLLDQLLYAVKFGDPNLPALRPGQREQQGPLLPQAAGAGGEAGPGSPSTRTPTRRSSTAGSSGSSTATRPPTVTRWRRSESFDTMTDDSLDDGSQFSTLPTDEINYMRNAVKATVDAYDGTVNLYAWDESDPILQAWRGAFPGTVQDRGDIPDSLMEHLRYPEDLFKVQRYQFARYHVTEAHDFYQGNNRWEVPQDPEAPGNYQPPYRMFVEQPGEVG